MACTVSTRWPARSSCTPSSSPSASTRATATHRTAWRRSSSSASARPKCAGEVWESEGGYTNDVFVNISDVVDKKLAALDCLVSQGYGGEYARKRIESSDGAFGQMANCPYAEGFISLKSEVHYYLPLTEHEMMIASFSDHEIIRHESTRHKGK